MGKASEPLYLMIGTKVYLKIGYIFALQNLGFSNQISMTQHTLNLEVWPQQNHKISVEAT